MEITTGHSDALDSNPTEAVLELMSLFVLELFVLGLLTLFRKDAMVSFPGIL